MVTNLHELTKQLDALTYNARSVLNALIRSTVSAGSYDGYGVTRAGKEIKLSRLDIYRLYSFYQDWAYNKNYVNTEDEFNALVAAHDNKDVVTVDGVTPATGTKTTDALVRHAQLMYLNASNADEDNDYWLAKVRTSANPKLFTNTAPIPINIRTPIYDENLSTKNFSQFETYLFPAAYNTLHMLGYAGDGEDHYAGGKTWTFEVDDKLSILAPHTSFGYHDESTTRENGYNDMSRSVDIGYNSYAYGMYSLVTGFGSAATRSAYAGVAFGDRVINDAEGGAALGGQLNRVTYGVGAATVGGYNNDVISPYGMASNISNHVGGYSFEFTSFIGVNDTSNANTITVCDGSYASQNECLTRLITDGDTSVIRKNSTILGTNQVCITPAALSLSGLNKVDFTIGDKVILYAMTRTLNAMDQYSFYDKDGYPYTYITRTVTGIDYQSKYGTIVSFDDDVIQTFGPDTIGGGRIARASGAWTFRRANGKNAKQGSVKFGWGSTAFNYNNIALGAEQTVVGSSNLAMIEPNFIVGVGTSYIESHRSGVGRANSFVSAPNYTYMKPVSPLIGMGVSTYSNNTLVFSTGSSDEDSNEAIYKFSGAYAYSMSDTRSSVAARMVASYIASRFTINDDGVVIGNPKTAGFAGTKANVSLGSTGGSTVIYSGGSTVFPTRTYNSSYVTWYQPYKKYVPTNRPGSVVVAAADNVVVNAGYQMYLNSTSYLTANFSHLYMTGDTYGTLPADSNSMSHVMTTSGTRYVANPGQITHSGFYYSSYVARLMDIPKGGYGSRLSGFITSYIGSFHTVNSAHATNTNGFDITALLMPGDLTDGWGNTRYISARPHPIVMNTSIIGNRASTHLTEQLAFVSDFDLLMDRGHVISGTSTWTSSTINSQYGGTQSSYIESNYGVSAYISAASHSSLFNNCDELMEAKSAYDAAYANFEEAKESFDEICADMEENPDHYFNSANPKAVYNRKVFNSMKKRLEKYTTLKDVAATRKRLVEMALSNKRAEYEKTAQWIQSDIRIDGHGRVYMDSFNRTKTMAAGDANILSNIRFALTGGVMSLQFDLNGSSQLFRYGALSDSVTDTPLKEMIFTIPIPKSFIKTGMRQVTKFTGAGYSMPSKGIIAEADLYTSKQSFDDILGMAIPAYTMRVRLGTSLMWNEGDSDNWHGTCACGNIPITLMGVVQYNDF